jgi:hypothetical protein
MPFTTMEVAKELGRSRISGVYPQPPRARYHAVADPIERQLGTT